MSVGSIVRVHLNGVGGRRRVYHVTWQKLWFGNHVICQRNQNYHEQLIDHYLRYKSKDSSKKNVPIKHEIIMTFLKVLFGCKF